MEPITNDYISTNNTTTVNSSTSLGQVFLSQSLTVILGEMQKTQAETNKRLDQLFSYIAKTSQGNYSCNVESFCFSIAGQDKISLMTGSPMKSPYKRTLTSSQSIKYNKSPDTFFQLKRFTEDESEMDMKMLYRVKSVNDIKEVKKEMLLEDNEEKSPCARPYENYLSHRTSETAISMRSNTSMNSNSKEKDKKIRGFNFKNKIDLKEQNHYQARKRSNYDTIRSHSNNIIDMYDPSHPANMIITSFNDDTITSMNNANPTLNKPQIIPEKHAKRYWNISMTKTKPNQIQQRLKQNLAKLLNNKKEVA